MRWILKIALLYSFNLVACSSNDYAYISCKDAAEEYLEQVCSSDYDKFVKTGDEQVDKLAQELYDLNSIKSLEDIKNPENTFFYKKMNHDLNYKSCSIILRHELCFDLWKLRHEEALWDQMLKTNAINENIKYLNDRLQFIADNYIESTKAPWYFKLAPNKKDNLPMVNKLLRKLEGVITSEKSSKILRSIFNEIKKDGLKIQPSLDSNINSINAAMGTQSQPRFVIPMSDNLYLLFGKIFHRSIYFNIQTIYRALDKSNQYFIDWILTHELAHVYTVLVQEKFGARLSRESRRDIEQRHRSCLYHDKESKKKFGEDLADLIAFSALEKIYPNGADIEDLKNVTKNVCIMQEYNRINNIQKEVTSAHSSPKERYFNMLKHNKHFQKILGCKEDRLVCSIKM